MTNIMRGPSLLREHIQTYLSVAVPAAIDVARTQYSLTEFQLPYPRKFDSFDPTMVGNEDFPQVGTTVLSSRNYVREEVDALAQQIYSVIYAVRIMVVARTELDADGKQFTPQKQSAQDLCQTLTHLVLETILDYPTMNQPDSIAADESTMLVDYSEPIQSKTQGTRWVAASTISLDVKFTESTYQTKIGDADTIVPTIDLIEP